MKDIKIAFFDIDWTLFDHKQHKWIESSLEAIKKLQSNGVKCFLCSARSYSSCKLFGTFSLGINWDGGVYSAGSTALTKYDVIYTEKIPNKDVKRFLQIMDRFNCVVEVVGVKKTAYHKKMNNYVREYRNDYRDRDPQYRRVDYKDVTCFLAFAPKEVDEIVRETFPNMYMYRFHKYGLDCKGFEYSKGYGVKKVLDYFGFSKDQAVAFGDDIQDIPVANEVSNFIAVGNAKDEVKKSAAFVCDPIDEDGIAKFLKSSKLI